MGNGTAMAPDAALDAARGLYARQAWASAHAAFGAADAAGRLGAADLERLAICAYLSGHDDAACDAWARAHRSWVAAGDVDAALRSALWLGLVSLLAGQTGHASGWFARLRSAAGDADPRSLAAAYVEEATGLAALFSGDQAAATGPLGTAARIAAHHGDADLAALARLGCGQALIETGRLAEGFAMLDEAMVAVAAAEVSPIAAGLVYCAVIYSCQEVFDLGRAQEWTAALSRWCDAQPELVPYRGQCLIHRSELLRIRGDWIAAVAEADRAARQLSEPVHPALGAAIYERAELHRLRGEVRAAEEAYLRASDAGHGAQPGLALLRLAQRRVAAARAAIDVALTEPRRPGERAGLVAAQVEVLLADGDVGGARAAAEELAAISRELGSPPMLAAMADDAIGAVALAEGDSRAALRAWRRAWTRWHEIDAPYEAARTRLQIGRACQGIGDEETAMMEFAAARGVFVRLGAVPDIARADALLTPSRAPCGLTGREVEVLSLVASGATNRTIARQLVISEKTVARHLSNIFAKLGVSSRAAATAFAYEHDLV